MVSDLYRRLLARIGLQGKRETELRFQGLDSYIRCLGHVLNLIVKDILRSLGSGTRAEADQACDSLGNGGSFATESALSKLRVLAPWVQRRQRWKEGCRINNMYDKYIQYDVDTRWNSTYRMIQEDWSRLKQLKTLLSKFDDFTSEISKNAPQISMALPIYYELHELLHDASDRCGQFSELDLDLVAAVKQGLKKYKKYYTFMD